MGVLSNNYAQIVPGALISASYVSDIYNVLMGASPESIVLSGSLTISGSTISTLGFTGSLHGTSSWAISASKAISAVTASYAISASYINYINSSSQSDTAVTASYVQTAQTASYYGGSVTSASYATTASYYGGVVTSSSFASSGNGIFSGSFSGSFTGDGSLLTNLPFALGNMLFVSPSGSDTDTTRSGHIGNISKPFRTLQAARNAAMSGDLIYVLPQTIIFDNTSGAYNSNLNDLNMWKDGVTYYWSPGTKVKIYNIIGNTLNRIYFFRPLGTVYETCSTIGSLEYEQTTTGGPPAYGAIYYFFDTQNTAGYEFFSQTKSQIGYSNEIINVGRDAISLTGSAAANISKVTIISDYEKVVHSAQMDGTGAGNYVSGGDNILIFNSYVKERYYDTLFAFNCRYNFSKSTVNFFGETMRVGYGVGEFFTKIVDLRYAYGTINVDIKKTTLFENSANTNASGIYARSGNDGAAGGVTLNYTGDITEISTTGSALALFRIDSANNTINYSGNITTSPGNSGRIICSVSNNSIVNIKGNIIYSGVSSSISTIFATNGSAKLKYTGNILGNFASTVAQCGTGTIEINNSRIESTNSGSNSLVLTNGGSSLGTVRINNSAINLSNSSSIGNGAYVKAIINNSTIVNSSTVGSGIANSGANGSLNLINSTIISPSSSINYPSGSNVVMANAVVSSTYIISNPVGSINLITDITY